MTTSGNALTEAQRIVRTNFAIVGRASPLGGYSNTNSRIDTDQGERYVLRISAADADVNTMLQVEDTMAAASEASFATSHAVATVHNDPFAILNDGRIARLHTWVPGATYTEIGHPAAAAESIGRTAGEMVQILSGAKPRTSRAHSQWDLRNAQRTIARLRHQARSGAHLSIIQAVLDRLLEMDMTHLPLQVVHNDLNQGNLLLTDDAVSGVIDFDDATMTYRIAELAIACAYAMLDQDDPVSIATEACRGYRRFISTTDAEAKSLFDLILARLATSVCIAASQPEGNPHHHDTETSAWNLLARLIHGDTDAIANEIERAARGLAPNIDPVDGLMAARDVLGPSATISRSTSRTETPNISTMPVAADTSTA